MPIARCLAIALRAIEVATSAACCWGANQWGQLDTGNVDRVTGHDWRGTNHKPRRVTTDARFALIAAGVDHTCGVTDGREVLCWGRTTRGATGATDWPTQEKPKVVRMDAK